MERKWWWPERSVEVMFALFQSSDVVQRVVCFCVAVLDPSKSIVDPITKPAQVVYTRGPSSLIRFLLTWVTCVR